MIHATPVGVSDFLPKDAKRLGDYTSKLQQFFAQANYLPVKTPTIEFTESFEHAFGLGLKKQLIEFFDPSGKRLMLRPDHTTPIARTVAARMQHEALPLRLFYVDPVFRKSIESQQTDTEIFQAGCECFGDSSHASVFEIISLCINALRAIGVDDIGIDLGHVDFTAGLSEDKKQALLSGDYLCFGSIPDRGKQECAVSQSDINAIFQYCEQSEFSESLWINKGLVKGLYYYTGVIFEVYSTKTKQLVASGGQYDQLCSCFGYDIPAVGFALNLNACWDTEK